MPLALGIAVLTALIFGLMAQRLLGIRLGREPRGRTRRAVRPAGPDSGVAVHTFRPVRAA